MSLLTGFLIGTVASIAASVICDFLSEKEKRKQMEMRQRYDDYKSERLSEYHNNVSGKKRRLSDYNDELDAEYWERKRRQLDERREACRPLYDQYLTHLNEQRSVRNDMLEKLRSALKEWEQLLKTEQQTYVRNAAVKMSILSITEAVYKLEAYIEYLETYEKKLISSFENDAVIPEPFSMTLPLFYPYEGKLYTLRKSDFSYVTDENGKISIYNVPDVMIGRMFVQKDEDREIINKSNDDSEIPVIVVKNKKSGKMKLSASKGLLRASIGSSEGISAEVFSCKYGSLVLKYNGAKLFLPRNYRINSNRGTPVGSKLKVYLKDYDFAMNNVIVTERYEESLTLAQFGNIPMLAINEQYDEFYRFIKDNNYLDLYEEWRVGPFEEEDNSTVRFQVGSYYGFLAEFTDTDSGGKNILHTSAF